MNLRVLFVFSAVCWTLSASICEVCDKSTCRPLGDFDCPLGRTKDNCKCCDVCYKTFGQLCAGINNTFGECGGDLHCISLSVQENSERVIGGVCLRSSDLDAFGEVVEDYEEETNRIVEDDAVHPLGRFFTKLREASLNKQNLENNDIVPIYQDLSNDAAYDNDIHNDVLNLRSAYDDVQ